MRDLVRYAKLWGAVAIASRLIVLVAVLVMLGLFISGGGDIHLTWSVGHE